MRYAWVLIPFGFGVWLAHYGFHLLTGGLTLVPVTQSAVIDLVGWPALGDPKWQWTGMRPGAVFPIQLGFILLGTMGSLALSYLVSERDYPAAASSGGRPVGRARGRPGRRRGMDPVAADGDERHGPLGMSGSAGARAIAFSAAAALAAAVAPALAHSGPPFPIVSDAVAGPYRLSIWTDPDTTDDGTPGGQFWVVIDPLDGAVALPPDTTASIAITPVDRPGPTRTGRTAPVTNQAGRQFVALLIDHEGRFAVRAAVEGPLGQAVVDAEVEATYDLRPAPIMVAVYLMPFVLVGLLWGKLLLARRRGRRDDRLHSRGARNSARLALDGARLRLARRHGRRVKAVEMSGGSWPRPVRCGRAVARPAWRHAENAASETPACRHRQSP